MEPSTVDTRYLGMVQHITSAVRNGAKLSDVLLAAAYGGCRDFASGDEVHAVLEVERLARELKAQGL